MIKKVDLSQNDLWSSIAFFRPNRPVLVTTRNRDGTNHVAPFAWCVPTSANPPMVTLALLSSPRRQHSLVNIERDGQFVVNFPGHDLGAEMVKSSFRYPTGVYKAGILGFEFEPSQCVDAACIRQCRANIECRLSTSLKTGDHTLLVADVVSAHYQSEQYSDGYILDVEHYPPCLHLGHRPSEAGQAHSFMVGDRIATFDLSFNFPCLDSDVRQDTSLAEIGAQVDVPEVGSQDAGHGWKVETTVFATGFVCPDGLCSGGAGGDAFVVDWPVGGIYRITPDGQVKPVAETDGMPASAACGPDGNLYVCDSGRKQLIQIGENGIANPVVEDYQGRVLQGPSDVVFDAGGNLYLSDGDGCHPADAPGTIYLRRPDGAMEVFAENIGFPGRLCLSPDGSYLYVAETFANRIRRFTLDDRGHAKQQEVFAQLCGGLGPDGITTGEDGLLYVAHFGKGVVVVLDQDGQLLAELPTIGFLPMNVTFWNGALYVTELERGSILRMNVTAR